MKYFLDIYMVGEVVPSTILGYDSVAARENDFHNLKCGHPSGWFTHTAGTQCLHISHIVRIIARDEK